MTNNNDDSAGDLSEGERNAHARGLRDAVDRLDDVRREIDEAGEDPPAFRAGFKHARYLVRDLQLMTDPEISCRCEGDRGPSPEQYNDEVWHCADCQAILAVDTPGGRTMTDNEGPFWCPYCEAVIVIGGEVVTKESDAYWHAYDHMDKAPYAFQVLDEFIQLSTVETEQKPDDDPGLGTVDGGP